MFWIAIIMISMSIVIIGDLAYILHWLICRKKYPCYSESCPLRKHCKYKVLTKREEAELNAKIIELLNELDD